MLDLEAFLELEMCLAIEMYYVNANSFKYQQYLLYERYIMPGLPFTGPG